MMKFTEGGLFCFDRDESCFIKYLVTQIQSAQLRLKNDQLDINADFEECIAAILKFGEPLCISTWWEMKSNPETGYLTTSTIGIIDFPKNARTVPFAKTLHGGTVPKYSTVSNSSGTLLAEAIPQFQIL